MIRKTNLALLIDLYELTMAQSYFDQRLNLNACFDLFIRRLPAKRNFFVAAGLEDIINYIRNLKFSSQDIKFLRSKKLFSEDFLRYLKKFSFKGDVWALPEGTVFFPGETVISVSANIIEAQILESFLLNTINLQTTIASKAVRVVMAAKGRGVFDFSLRRTQGQDAALKAARSSYIAGSSGTSNVLAGYFYKIPVAGTMAHSFVMSFDSELESFRSYARSFPSKAIILIDTYNSLKGLKNAITVAKELRSKKIKLKGIRLDSGDMVALSKTARKTLDKEGLKFVKIFASGNLDEYKIERLLQKSAKIDSFGVGTNMGVSVDAPYSDVIYKISQITFPDGKFIPTMKLSAGKATYPGKKKIYRILKNGKFSHDVIALDSEKIRGKELLLPVFKKGKLVYKIPAIEQVRKHCQKQLRALPETHKALKRQKVYPVKISKGLEELKDNLVKILKRTK